MTTQDRFGWCRSGRHYWMNPVSRELCCNGYRRVLRTDGPEPGDLRAGMDTVAGTACVWVWVRQDAAADTDAGRSTAGGRMNTTHALDALIEAFAEFHALGRDPEVIVRLQAAAEILLLDLRYPTQDGQRLTESVERVRELGARARAHRHAA